MKYYFLMLLILPTHSVIMYGASLLQAGGANLQIEFAGVEPGLPKTCIIAKISKSAQAVATSMVGFLFPQHVSSSSWPTVNKEFFEWSETPVGVDLPLLWNQLGVRQENGHIVFDDAAPLSRVSMGITAPRTGPNPRGEKYDRL